MTLVEELAATGFDPGGVPHLSPVTPDEAGLLMDARGWLVTTESGVVWRSGRRRWFWSPIDPLEPIAGLALRPPRAARMGYLATVDSGGNTSLVAEIVPGLDRLSLRNQPTERRRQEVVGALRRNEFSFDPQVVIDAGWEVMLETRARSRHRAAANRRAFANEVRTLAGLPGGIVIASRYAGVLTGFITAHVLGRAVYLDDLCLTATGLRVRAGAGLYWLAMVAGALVPGVVMAYLGPWYPENQGLHYYKGSLGARVFSFAARGDLHPAAAAILRAQNPYKYVRFGGADLRLRERIGVPAAGCCAPLTGTNTPRSGLPAGGRIFGSAAAMPQPAAGSSALPISSPGARGA